MLSALLFFVKTNLILPLVARERYHLKRVHKISSNAMSFNI